MTTTEVETSIEPGSHEPVPASENDREDQGLDKDVRKSTDSRNDIIINELLEDYATRKAQQRTKRREEKKKGTKSKKTRKRERKKSKTKVKTVDSTSGVIINTNPKSTDPTDGHAPLRSPSGPRLLPNRPKLDIARDTKRILEICYGANETGPATMANSDGVEGSIKPLQGDEETGDAIKPNSRSSITSPCGIAEASSWKGNKTPSSPKKKRKKKKEGIVRDAAGRIIRRRRKGKGRDRVVKKEFLFRKGKDINIGLDTIDESFYDDLSQIDSGNEDLSSNEYETCSSEDQFSSEDAEEENDFDSENIDETCEGNAGQNSGPLTQRTARTSEAGSNAGGIDDHTTLNDRAVETPGDSVIVADMVPSTDNQSHDEESFRQSSMHSSLATTECTSTASAQPQREEKPVLCFRSRRRMICIGSMFVLAIAAVTILVGYFFYFRHGYWGIGPKNQELAPTTAPSTLESLDLEPVSTQSPTLTPTQSPTSIMNVLSNTCYLPNTEPGTITIEAEYAPEQYGFPVISNVNGGHCGDGYVTMSAESEFGFPSIKVDTTGYYKIALRYNHAEENNEFLRLQIDNRDEGTFELRSTESENSWLVAQIDNVLLRRGEHAMRISMVDSNNARGPNVDWITLIPQNHLPKFEYLSGLIAQANGMSAQTLSQTRTILWMSNEDPLDYSSLTDQEIIERYSLVQIYHSTAGDAWANNNEWLSDFHACSWYGVTCSIDMLVTDLMLDNNNLIGYLPTDLSLLTNLILLSLDNNNLQGPIPAQIGKLVNLSKLFLQSNFLDGRIPSELGSLERLQTIDLRTNTLSGSIPEDLYSMDMLEVLRLGSNYFLGTLSTSVGQLKTLRNLDLKISQLSGTIPSELGELTLLTNLALAYNQFSGQIPKELGFLKNLEFLDMNSNRLTGTLPPELGLLEDTIIDYDGNDILT